MSCLPKPVLRGHIKRRGIKGLIGAACLAAVNGTLYNFLISAPRKAAMEKAAETYDGEAHFEDLVKLGYISFDEVLSEVKS